MQICFFLFLLVPTIAGGSKQLQGRDSTFQSLHRATPATYRAAYQQLEEELEKVAPAQLPSTLAAIQRISKRFRFKGPQAAGYRLEALVYQRLNQIPQALQAATEAVQIARRDQLTLELADNLFRVGHLYRAIGQLDSTLHYLLQAEALYSQQRQRVAHAQVVAQIGSIFYNTGQYEVALSHLRQALTLGNDSLDARTRISLLNTVALIHRNRKQFPQAMDFQNRSLQLAQAVKDSAWIGITTGNLGRLYELQGKDALALQYYQTNLALSRKFSIWGDVVTTLSGISQLYSKRHQYVAARAALQEALQIAHREKEYDDLVPVYQAYTAYFQQSGQLDSAFYYQKRYYQTKDSLERQYFNTRIEQIRTTFEFDKKQAEITLLKKNNALVRASEQRKNTWLLVVAVLLMGTALLTGLLYRGSRQKQKANRTLRQQQKELFDKNEEIQAMNNNLEQLVGVRTSSLEQALRQLQERNEELDQYVYKVSHDIRSPVASLLGLIKLTQLEAVPSPVGQYLSMMENRINRLDEFIKSVLSHSRSLNTPTSVTPIDFNQIISQCLEELQYYPQVNQVRIERQFPPAGAFWGDDLRLQLLFKNLISNALKYRNPQVESFLSVRIELDGKKAVLQLEDNGQGIAPEYVDKVFQMFFRASEKADGSGLGLYIVKQAVERMGGTITLTSQLGQGTTFTITLPNQKPQSEC